ncbi:MAG: bifunctional phosphoglucose/phosphomannose isomerase [Candidatus Electryonea clarkiae]|nr:bifunctional phosphoglucose/phosphomannose isomerase [Candidatus Electryonea clarkiae]MDP8286893.1 bifunctional phosphoglucose/phosphomannose isomerase [Candidatus Electryonea clarkiae]
MIKFDESVDISGMRANLESFPDQVRVSWETGIKIGSETKKAPPGFLIWAGMGGSAIGGDFCAVLANESAAMPIMVHRGGPLPAWVKKDHHILLVSYSGNTAETLNVAQQAVERGCGFDAMTSGGRIGEWIQEQGNTPWIVPGGMPPRAAFGHLFACSYAVLTGRGWCQTQDGDIAETRTILDRSAEELKEPPVNNSTQLGSLVHGLLDKLPMIYGTGKFVPVARRWACQFNENAKIPAHWGELPEMNHNEVVAYRNGSQWGNKCSVIILEDPNSPEDVRLRVDVTLKLAREAGWDGWIIRPKAKHPIAGMLEMTMLGDWLSYWLAIAQGVDPTPIPTIDRLKAAL